MKFYFSLLFLILFSFSGASEIRGIWIDGFGAGLKTREQVKKTVADAKKMNVNTLFVQTIRRSDCFCLKSSLPVVADKDLEKNFDPLEELIKHAKAENMRVIAWASVTGAGNLKNLNTDANHVFKLHGNTKDSWLNMRFDKTWQEGHDAWLDPGIPQAVDFMVQGVVSIVRNYDIDGIQLDRIRYPDGGDWGYNPRSLAQYILQTDKKSPTKDDEFFRAWKREQINALVRQITLESKAIKPDIWISAATITYGNAPKNLKEFESTATYRLVSQNWPFWLETGILDLNVPMNYKRETNKNQAIWFDDWNVFAKNVQAKGLTASGISIYLNEAKDSALQIERTKNLDGWVIYSYRTPTLSVYQGRQSQEEGRAELANLIKVNKQAWTDKPLHNRGVMGKIVGKERLGNLEVEILQNNNVIAKSLTSGNGFYGFMDVPQGEVKIRVSGQSWKTKIPAKGVTRVPNLVIRDLVPASIIQPSTAPIPGIDETPIIPPSKDETERDENTPG